MLRLAQARNKPAYKRYEKRCDSTSPIGSSAAAIIIFIFSPPRIYPAHKRPQKILLIIANAVR